MLRGRAGHGLGVSRRGASGRGADGGRWWWMAALFRSEVFPTTKIKVGIIEIIFEEASQVSGGVLEFGNLQTSGRLEMPRDPKKLHHFLGLLGERFVDSQGADTIRPRHFEIVF